MIVSLNATFLSALVLITWSCLIDEVERALTWILNTCLLTERGLTRVLPMLDAIQEKLGVENREASELADLEDRN